jgi:formylglycine-generating enzyme required for sulfatase activity
MMWTIEDNGKEINWDEANEYAKQLRLGGYSDWRLPTIEELEKLYDPRRGGERKIRKPLQLTGWFVWSPTKQGSASAWGFDFYYGKRHRANLDYSFAGRAFCVRGLGE